MGGGNTEYKCLEVIQQRTITPSRKRRNVPGRFMPRKVGYDPGWYATSLEGQFLVCGNFGERLNKTVACSRRSDNGAQRKERRAKKRRRGVGSEVAHQPGSYPTFLRMKRPGVFLFFLEGVNVLRWITSKHLFYLLPFILLSGRRERCYESKVCCPRTQCSDTGKGSSPNRSGYHWTRKTRFVRTPCLFFFSLAVLFAAPHYSNAWNRLPRLLRSA